MSGDSVLENDGWCPICEAPAHFVARESWLRAHYRCEGCHSVPRHRALMLSLQERFPDWRELRIHESSPAGPLSKKLDRECAAYLPTHYWPDVRPGDIHEGVRCENLERQTFGDEVFDLVVTQDVMEHVLDPWAAYREIARTLRPGGAHVFTTPIYKNLGRSRPRARHGANGAIEYLEEAEYHMNPIDSEGSLVTIDYGQDIGELIMSHAGTPTTIYRTIDQSRGLLAEFLEVLVSVKIG